MPFERDPVRMCHPGAIAFRVEADAAARSRRRSHGGAANGDASGTAGPAVSPSSTDDGRLPVAHELGVELDLVAHELLRAGRPVRVRPKEFLLLTILAANPGRAFSRRQLLDLAWDPD